VTVPSPLTPQLAGGSHHLLCSSAGFLESEADILAYQPPTCKADDRRSAAGPLKPTDTEAGEDNGVGQTGE
jgi:hypothetical protein